jgi:tyrosyl-tRNA synthetase
MSHNRFHIVHQQDELRNLFETNEHPIAYDGFEPSGIAPIHFGLLRATNLKNMLKAGIFFARMNTCFLVYLPSNLHDHKYVCQENQY